MSAIESFKNAFRRSSSDDRLAKSKEKARSALRPLKDAVDALAALGADVEPHKGELQTLAIRYGNIVKSRGNTDQVCADLEELAKDAKKKTPPAQKAALSAPQAQDGAGGLLAQAKAKGDKPGKLRSSAKKALAADPQFLVKLAALDGGNDLIDQMVADLGGKARGADNAFVQEAIKARFDVEGADGRHDDEGDASPLQGPRHGPGVAHAGQPEGGQDQAAAAERHVRLHRREDQPERRSHGRLAREHAALRSRRGRRPQGGRSPTST